MGKYEECFKCISFQELPIDEEKIGTEFSPITYTVRMELGYCDNKNSKWYEVVMMKGHEGCKWFGGEI